MASKYVMVEDVEELKTYHSSGLLYYRYRGEIDRECRPEFTDDWKEYLREWLDRTSWDAYILVEEDE